jgi:hypothetical protein
MSAHDALIAIDADIAIEKKALSECKGRETEVWKRIIGYYGNTAPGVRLPGRQEEIDQRVMFDVPQALAKIEGKAV